MALHESALEENNAIYDITLKAGEPWIHEIKKGYVLRIVDLYGNQAVDTLFYNSRNHEERYSAVDTVRLQGSIYLAYGSQLLSGDGNKIMTIVADTCGNHDTLFGACSAESNSVRYGLDTLFMHNCRDTFITGIKSCNCKLSKTDLTANVNFFMNVPVNLDGSVENSSGISGAGRYVEMRADMDAVVLISNCPQLNNPCNNYDPTPVRLLIWPPN